LRKINFKACLWFWLLHEQAELATIDKSYQSFVMLAVMFNL